MDQRNGITDVAFQEEKFNAKNKHFTILKENVNSKIVKVGAKHHSINQSMPKKQKKIYQIVKNSSKQDNILFYQDFFFFSMMTD